MSATPHGSVRSPRAARCPLWARLSGVAGPPGDAEVALLGIALAPDDEETLFAYLSTPDERPGRADSAWPAARSGPAPVRRGIPSGVRHHGGRLLFARTDAPCVDRRFGAVGPGPGPQFSRRQDPADPARRRSGAWQPVRQPDLEHGHRNIEGLACNAKSGDGNRIGEQEADELNLISRGRNYGWPRSKENLQVKCSSPRK